MRLLFEYALTVVLALTLGKLCEMFCGKGLLVARNVDKRN